MVILSPELQQRVQQAINAGAPPEEAIRRAIAIQNRTQQQQPGLLRKMATPFERAGRTILGGAVEGGIKLTDLFGRLTGQIPKGSPQIRQLMAERGFQNPLMSEQTLNKFGTVGGAAKETGRTVAGLASYGIPFGLGGNIVTKGVLPGAVAGGLFETGQPGTGMKEIQRGAAFGGVTGGLLSGIGTLLGKLRGAGTSMRGGVVKPKVPATPKFAQAERELVEEAGQLGLKGSARGQGRELGNLFTQASDDLQRAVGQSDVTVKASSLADDFTKAAERVTNIQKGTGKTNYQFWKKQIGSGKLGSKELGELYRKLLPEVGRVFKKQALGTPLTAKEKVAIELYSLVGDVLKQDKSISGLLNKMSTMHKLAPGLKKSAEQAGARLPLYGKIKATGQPTQWLQDLLGRGMQTAGKATGGISPATTQLSSLLAASQAGGGQQQAMPTTTTPLTSLLSQQQGISGMMPQQVQQPTSELQQLLTPDVVALANLMLSSSEAEKLNKAYEAIEETKPQLTPAENTALVQAQEGLSILSTLKQQYGAVQQEGLTARSPGLGRLGGTSGTIASILQSSPNAAAYDNVKSAFLSKLSRATGERGVLTDRDLERIASAIPGFYDTPETAVKQWDLIEDIISSAIAAKQGYR